MLLDQLGSEPDPTALMELAEKLSELGEASPRVVEFLTEQLSPDQPEIASRAAHALARMGGHAAGALERMGRLAGGEIDPDLKTNLEYAIDQIEMAQVGGERSAQENLALASDDSAPVAERLAALSGLQDDPPEFEELRDFVSRLLVRPEAPEELLEPALFKLAQFVYQDFSFSPRLAPAVPSLTRCLKEWQGRSGLTCARILALVRPRLPDASVEPLFEAFDLDTNPQFRSAAIDALRRVPAARKRLLDKLVDLVENETDPELLVMALQALAEPVSGQPPNEESVPLLEPFIVHSDRQVQVEALRSLARLGPAARASIPGLDALLRDPATPELVQRLADLAIRMITHN
jgi:HEAT repeat protein